MIEDIDIGIALIMRPRQGGMRLQVVSQLLEDTNSMPKQTKPVPLFYLGFRKRLRDIVWLVDGSGQKSPTSHLCHLTGAKTYAIQTTWDCRGPGQRLLVRDHSGSEQ